MIGKVKNEQIVSNIQDFCVIFFAVLAKTELKKAGLGSFDANSSRLLDGFPKNRIERNTMIVREKEPGFELLNSQVFWLHCVQPSDRSIAPSLFQRA